MDKHLAERIDVVLLKFLLPPPGFPGAVRNLSGLPDSAGVG